MTDKPTPKVWPLWVRLLVAGGLAVVLILPLWLWHDDIVYIFQQREQVIAEVRNAGAWAPLALIGLAVVQTVVAPIPGQAVNFVAGYIFGLIPGTLISWVGLVVGATVAMWLARYLGRPVVEKLVGRRPLDRLDGLAAGRGLGFFFLAFLIPGLPDDLLCFVAGLTRLPLRGLILFNATARIPGLVGAVWLGASAEALPWQAWAIGGALALVGVWVMWRFGDRFQESVLKRLGDSRTQD